MRIAYFIHWNEGAKGTTYMGVLNKINDQIKVWQKLNNESKLFILTNKGSALSNPAKMLGEFPACVFSYQTRFDQFEQASKLVNEIAFWQPDVVYCRYTSYMPALQKMVRDTPTVLEVNSNILSELITVHGYSFRYWYIRITENWWLKDLRGMVFVSHELSGLPKYVRYKKPSIVIANGIDLTRYPSLPAAGNLIPRLVFIGSMAPWQGTDKIIQLAHLRPNWQFDFIGPLSDETQSQLPPNVVAHGFLTKSQYEQIFREADVAIGSMALYRNNMSEASPLKVREYLSYGVPTIVGYKETDFPESTPFLLRLPNTSDNIIKNLDTITEFVYRWKGKRISRKDVAALDVNDKERRRLEFLSKIVLMQHDGI
jgi:glycosyltransferase involved in cell wall biosynthesis